MPSRSKMRRSAFCTLAGVAEVDQHEVGAGVEVGDRVAQIGEQPVTHAGGKSGDLLRIHQIGQGVGQVGAGGDAIGAFREESSPLSAACTLMMSAKVVASILGTLASSSHKRFERVGRADQADAAVDLEIGGRIAMGLAPDAVRQEAVAAEEADRDPSCRLCAAGRPARRRRPRKPSLPGRARTCRGGRPRTSPRLAPPPSGAACARHGRAAMAPPDTTIRRPCLLAATWRRVPRSLADSSAGGCRGAAPP